MSDKVFANGRAIAGKGTAHMARTFGPTDICKVPPQNIPAPFPNFVMTSKLGAGQTSKTMLGGKPIWTAAGKLSPSEPPHPGVGKGLISGTYRGAAQASTYSADVIVEGDGVVRLFDMTFQNDRNTVGIVDLSSVLANWLKSIEDEARKARGEAEQDGAEPEESDNPEIAEPETSEACDEEEPEPEPEPEPEKECCLTEVTVKDKTGRTPSPEGRLEVVVKDTLTCTAVLEGCCPDDAHPRWSLSGAGAKTLVGTEAKFDLPSQSLPISTGGNSFDRSAVFGISLKNLSTFTPRSYGLNVEAHEGKPKQISIKAYPDSSIEGEIDPKPLKAVKGIIATLMEAALKADGGSMSRTSFMKGKIQGSCGWKEHKDWRVFFNFMVSVGYKPFWGGYIKFFIPLPYIGPVQAAIRRFKLGRLDVFIRFSGGVDLVGSFGRTRPGGVGGEIKVVGKIGLDVGIDVAIGEDLLAAEAFGSSGITGEAKGRFGDGAYIDLKITWDGLSVSLIVTTSVWWLEFVKTNVKFQLVEPRKIYENKDICLMA